MIISTTEKTLQYSNIQQPPKDLYPAIQLTSGCNKQCRACLRSANAEEMKIKAVTFNNYLEDLKTLAEWYRIRFQFVTGGEPTIWKSQGRDTVDVLAALVNLELIDNITMPTNGKLFEDMNYARDFFSRLSSQIGIKIVVGVSIAGYQENLGENGYIALDNLLTLSRERGMKMVPVILVTLSANDDIDRRLLKLYPGVIQRVTPLAPLGDASGMTDDCPSISLAGNDKSGVGAFLPYFKNDVMKKLKVTPEEFDSMDNYTIINRLSLHAHCGSSPFIDNRWHFCLPFKEDNRFDLCGIGDMKPDTIDSFLIHTPFINCIRNDGILCAVDEHKNLLSAETRDGLEYLLAGKQRVSVAYRGCMVCKALYDINVIRELVDANCSCKR